MKPAAVFSSMRAQLTFWYTSVLALVLLIFALTSYTYIARAARQRTDDSLADTANSLVSNFNSELNDEGQSPEHSAQDAVSGLHFNDRQAIVSDWTGRIIVASDMPSDLAHEPNWFSTASTSAEIAKLKSTAAHSGHAYATLITGSDNMRVFAMEVPAGPQKFSFLIANSLRDEDRALAQARRAFYVAVPLALLIAGLGGYLLARKSLAPVVSMGERAARIGASNLDERIPVPARNHELGRLAGTFNDLLGRLDQSFERQRRFMADASHELRTPVAVICGESEVALSQTERESEEYRESLAIVHEEGTRLTRMVEDLFTLARADAGEYPLVLTDFYLDESIGECVRAVRSLATKKGLSLFYQPSAIEISFRGDESLLRRMIVNLLHNAIKYTPANGRVDISLKRNCDNFEVEVSDTGPGIPIDARDHVFERFFRADNARTRAGSFLNGSGAGLGLSIAKWAAELHGGHIVLNQPNGSGATFTVLLPLSRSGSEESRPL